MRLFLVVLVLGLPGTLLGQERPARSTAETAAATQHTSLDTAPSDAQLVSDVEALVARRLQESRAVGLSIAIARGAELVLAGGYGRAELEFDVAADTDTSFRIGSVTKPFTAAAIMRLVEQGKLALDDDMSDYLPDFPTQGHTVSIRHLLTHTSGIESFTSVAEFWRTGAARELSADELLGYVEGVNFEFEPGEQYEYSNTGYYLLGRIIEEVPVHRTASSCRTSSAHPWV